MKNIIKLHTTKPIIDQDIINKLEELLEKAKAGEIQTLTGCYLTNNLTMINYLAGSYEGQCINVIGMLADLQYDLLKIRNGED